jgi:hypothetical protein
VTRDDLDAVLASIDGALGDYSVSGDAMRWTPGDPEALPEWQPLGRGAFVPSFADAVCAASDVALAEQRVRVVFRVDEGALERFRETCRQAGARFADLVEALNPVMQKLGEVFAQLRPPGVPPPPALRATDPRAYALALRQSRGTGPDRQVQHRPRPRRHA